MVSEGPLVPGQAFQVQYVIEGARDIQQFTIPAYNDLHLLDSFESKSTSVQSPGFTLKEIFSKVVILSAKRTGRFTLPAASAIIDGKMVKSNIAKIEIISKNNSPVFIADEMEEDEVAVRRTSQLKPGENISEKINKNLFVRAIVSKSRCYTGEGILITYKMYSRLDASSQILKRPSLTGLSIIEMVDSYDGKPEIEKLDGVSYYVNLIRKVHGFPLQPGLVPLDKAEVSSTIHFVKWEEPVGRSNPGQPLSYSLFDYPVTLASSPLSIEVKPLPSVNQPENYSGAVGNFSFHIEVGKKEIHPGDLVKIRLVISGEGNIPLLVPPLVRWPKGVDTAEPIVKEELNKYAYPLKGSKSFEYSFTAPDPGEYIIPATNFYYFNPARKSYQYSRSDSIKLDITPGPGNSSALVQHSMTDTGSDAIPRQFYWFAGIVLIILGWVGYQVWYRKKDKKIKMTKKDPEVLLQTAITQADKLATAKIALRNGDLPSYYHELEKALWKEMAESFSILPSELNKQHAGSVLMENGLSSEDSRLLMEVLNECEWALYVPTHEFTLADNLLAKTTGLMEKISSMKGINE